MGNKEVPASESSGSSGSSAEAKGIKLVKGDVVQILNPLNKEQKRKSYYNGSEIMDKQMGMYGKITYAHGSECDLFIVDTGIARNYWHACALKKAQKFRLRKQQRQRSILK